MTQTTTNLTTWTPVQIDTELARIWGEIDKAQDQVEAYKAYLAREEKSGQPIRWAGGKSTAEYLAEYRAKLQELRIEADPYQDEYVRRGGWLRYFLVSNTNGHVHREMHCSTCFPTTRYNWLVNLADCDEDAMVEEWGELACTVCFPNAPTNPLYNRPSRRDREAQEAKAAEKAVKQAEKDAKAIKDLDGSELRVDGYAIKTKVAARNKLSDAFQSLVVYGLDHPQRFQDQVRKLVPVLDNAGVEWQGVAERAIKKALKDMVVPPNNPYRLTPEQIKEGEARHAANAKTARSLLEALRAEVKA
jgi:hypothetical protein